MQNLTSSPDSTKPQATPPMDLMPEDKYLVSRRYAWAMFAILFGITLVNFIDRFVVSALFPYLKEEFQLTDMQLGSLVSAVHIFMSVVVIPAGLLVDRWSRTKMVAIMCALWSFATLACIFARDFSHLLVYRALTGMGEGGYGPASTPLLSAQFPRRMRATVLGMCNSACIFGGVIGTLVGGWIAVHWGWKHAFGVVAVPGFLLAVIMWFMKDYKTVSVEVEDRKTGRKKKASFLEMLRIVATTPTLIACYVGNTVGMFYLSIVMSWLPSYFNRVEHLPADEAALKASLVVLTIGVGTVFGGFVVDRVTRFWKIGQLGMPALYMFSSGALFYLSFGPMQASSLHYPLMLGGALTLAAMLGPMYAASQDVSHPGVRATAVSMLVFVQNLVGMAMGPLVAGALSDSLGLGRALCCMAITPLIAGTAYFIGAFFYPRDVARVAAIKVQAA